MDAKKEMKCIENDEQSVVSEVNELIEIAVSEIEELRPGGDPM